MPIHLSPLSRRQFLTRSLVLGSVLAAAPRLLAAGRRPDPHSWALLADTHIPADRTLVSRGVNMARHFETATEQLLGLARPPAGVLIAGDLAHNTGQAGDYATLGQLLEPIRKSGLPIHLALGNHDHRERFWEGMAGEKRRKRPHADRQTALVRSSRVTWLVLDSLEATNSTPGLLGQPQLEWLAGALDANRSKPAVILVHHNPGVAVNISGLKDTESLFEVIRPRKQVKALIYGHTHRWSVERDASGIHLVNLPPVAYVFREGDPSGWVLATFERNGMRLEFHAIDPAHPANGQVLDLAWRA
jgi:Icc protein